MRKSPQKFAETFRNNIIIFRMSKGLFGSFGTVQSAKQKHGKDRSDRTHSNQTKAVLRRGLIAADR